MLAVLFLLVAFFLSQGKAPRVSTLRSRQTFLMWHPGRLTFLIGSRTEYPTTVADEVLLKVVLLDPAVNLV